MAAARGSVRPPRERGTRRRHAPRASGAAAGGTAGVRRARGVGELRHVFPQAASIAAARRRAGSVPTRDRRRGSPGCCTCRAPVLTRAPPIRRPACLLRRTAFERSGTPPPAWARRTKESERGRPTGFRGRSLRNPEAPPRSELQGTKASGGLRRPSRGQEDAGAPSVRLMVSDPQTGVAPGWTRGRKVRSKCR